jgi:hypothetical protein
MDEKDVNELLRDKYLELDKIMRPIINEKNQQQSNNSNKLVYPLFLKDNDYYRDLDPKLMIFGQETNGWGDGTYGDNKDTDVDTLMDKYFIFFNDGYPLKYTPFWQTVKKFMKTINKNKYDDEEKIYYLWNNLVKVGKQGKGFPDKWYNDIIKPYFNGLILFEIEILEPEFIIFFTGPEYDTVIDDVFNKPERHNIDGFTGKELCEVKIPNIKKSFRTYHPNFLYHNNKNRPYKEFLEKIIDEINKCL